MGIISFLETQMLIYLDSMDKQLIDMYYLYGWTGVNISLQNQVCSPGPQSRSLFFLTKTNLYSAMLGKGPYFNYVKVRTF